MDSDLTTLDIQIRRFSRESMESNSGQVVRCGRSFVLRNCAGIPDPSARVQSLYGRPRTQLVHPLPTLHENGADW